MKRTAFDVLVAMVLVIGWGAAGTGLAMLALSLAGWVLALVVAGVYVFASALVLALLGAS